MSADREACSSFFRNVFDAEVGAECGLYLESIRFLLTWIRRDCKLFHLWDCQLLFAVADCGGATHSADLSREVKVTKFSLLINVHDTDACVYSCMLQTSFALMLNKPNHYVLCEFADLSALYVYANFI